MAETEYSLEIINYLSFASSGATANFTNVTVIGLDSGTGTFTTIQATNYADLIGNIWLTISNGGQPTLQNSLNANGYNISAITTITATTGNFTNLNIAAGTNFYYQNGINLVATPTATSFYINTSSLTLSPTANNLCIGVGAGNNTSTGTNNVILGYNAG